MFISAWIPAEGGIRLRPPVDLANVEKLVVRDIFGQPVLVMVQMKPDSIWVSRRGDKDFDRILSHMGLTSNTVVQEVGHAVNG